MSCRVGTPMNRVNLSNVAVVKLTRKKKTFEVAAYPSKVVDYRNGVETDVTEVLQVENVFRNVSKGIVAPLKEITEVFGSLEKAWTTILRDGDLQVSEKERTSKAEQLFKEIAGIVAEKTAPSTIERAMHEAHWVASSSRGAKQQALDVIKVLEAGPMGLKRAPMRLRVTQCDEAAVTAALGAIDGVHLATVKRATTKGGGLTFLIEPRVYRDAATAVAAASDGKALVEVAEHAVRGDAVTQRSIADGVSSVALDDGGGGDDSRGSSSFFAATPKSHATAAALPRGRLQPTEPKPADAGPNNNNPDAKKLACNTCGGSFDDAAAHRAHFRSDWHRHNLRLKMADKPPVTEVAFTEEQMMLAADGGGDAS